MNDDQCETIVGYAACFHDAADPGTEFQLASSMVERIAPGAFTKALANGTDVTAQTNHDPNYLLGRQGSDPTSMILHEDARGLRVQILPLETTAGRDAIEMVRSNSLRGMSFGFSMAGGRDRWHREGNTDVRTLVEIGRLYDASPVVNPAYAATRCNLELTQRSVARNLAAYAERIHAIAESSRSNSTPTRRTDRMIEHADDRNRAAAAVRSSLKEQSRQRNRDLRARLLAEQVKIERTQPAQGGTRYAEIERELRTLAIDEESLRECMGLATTH